MSLKVNFREVVPTAIIGGVIGGVLALLTQLYVTSSMSQLQQQNAAFAGPPLELMIFVMMLSIAIGGFIAAYFATKNMKTRLGHAVATGVIAGLVSEFILALLTFVVSVTVILQNFNVQIFQELITITSILTLVTAFMGGVGGLVCAFLLGTGKSELGESFSKALKFVKQNKLVFFAVLLFTLIATGISLAVTYFNVDALQVEYQLLIALVVIIATHFLTAVSFTSVYNAYHQTLSLKDMIITGIKDSRDVFFASLITGIPILYFVAIISAMFWPLALVESVQEQISPLFFIISLVLLALLALYGIVFSFFPMVMLNSKKQGLIAKLKETFAFGKRNFFGIVAFILISTLVTLLLEFGFLVLELLLLLGNIEASQVLTAVWSSISFTYVVAAMVAFYEKAKK